jgi:hypothetical protein
MVVKSVCFSVQAALSKWEWSPASAAFVLARHLRPLTSGHVFLSREVRVRRFVWAIMYEGVFGMYLNPSNSASSRLVTLFSRLMYQSLELFQRWLGRLLRYSGYI